ncbi:potassium channel family protein [Methanosarcina barkeri]|uniref:Potassium channel protein n=3 Tax=Methanosarcina barkeri TaxID=2208 RepID=A0A0E3QWN9_METBA|nr:NAD-binding protein [Methanosarcina barkeri]AKB55137.1 Potassium channel protein [Methanosarcina barkeri MS]AKB56785.1 Potassium channel protein [Methanosarcina barkeri 227]
MGAKMESKGHLIVLGYGDVGKSIVDILYRSPFRFVVVDSNDKVFENVDFEHLVGNGADEDILLAAGVKTASFEFVALNDDTNVIFATLISRNLNPEITIVARANSVKSIEKIYKAGADYVGSLSIVAGQMLAKMTANCMGKSCRIDEDIMLYEGIEIEKYRVDRGSPLDNISIEELDLEGQIGCTIIGIERGNLVTTAVKKQTIIRAGDTIAVVGSSKQISEFKEKYVN